MHPILFSAGPVTIYSYGVLLASAYLLGLWLVSGARAPSGWTAPGSWTS